MVKSNVGLIDPQTIESAKQLGDTLYVTYYGFNRKMALRGLKCRARKRGTYINLTEVEHLLSLGKKIEFSRYPGHVDCSDTVLRAILRQRHEIALSGKSVETLYQEVTG